MNVVPQYKVIGPYNYDRIKIVDVIRVSHEFSFETVRVITIVVSNPVNFVVNARL